MRQTIGLMAACAALLASCTNEEMNEGLGIDTPIQVTANVEGIMTTRAENTEGNLDNFGLFIKDKDGGYDTNYGGENIEVSKPEDASAWTLADEVLYQGSGQTYFAYAPYQSIEAGATSVDFSIKTDQSGSEYMQASDLLYAAGSVTSPELTVNFSHKLCKLTVKLQTEADFSGTISYEHLYLRGCLPKTSLNLTDGTLGEAKGEAIDTEMWHNEESGNYECILVPQTVKYSVVVVAKVNNSPKSYVYTPANAYEFKSNNSYTLTLTIKEQHVQSEINSIKVAGDVFTSDIQYYLKQQHNIKVGEITAEKIKIAVGAVLPDLDVEPEPILVRGPNLMTAHPVDATITYQEIAHCLDKSVARIEAAVLHVLEQTPPELYSDIVETGIYLSGGGALLRGLDKRLSEKVNIPFHVAEDPLRAVARGTCLALKHTDSYPFLMR